VKVRDVLKTLAKDGWVLKIRKAVTASWYISASPARLRSMVIHLKKLPPEH